MTFRLKAFGIHLLGSACVLGLLLTALYIGWYQWPAWYLTGMWHITAILGGVDVTLGPLFTLIIANPNKRRRELARDIGVIVAVQLIALLYGTFTLWNGRPLYYTYSGDRIETVQAAELPAEESALARQQNPDFAPHWYSRSRWVWAPLPSQRAEQDRIISQRKQGDTDVTLMPRYFKPWQQGLPELRKQLKTVNQLFIFSRIDKDKLKQRMAAQGLAVDQPNTLFLSGSGKPLLVVFDISTLKIQALIRCD